MARLYLFAEGQTEQTFADTVLKPHLAKFGVYMPNPVLIATVVRRVRCIVVVAETFKRCRTILFAFFRKNQQAMCSSRR